MSLQRYIPSEIIEYIISFRPFTPNNKRELKDAIKLYRIRRTYCIQLLGDMNSWDVSKIDDMEDLFRNIKFNFDIKKWDVKNVKNFKNMFNGCEKFNCDLSKWNVSKGTSFEGMFEGCRRFNQSLNDWDMRNSTSIKRMFYRCKYNNPLNKWKLHHIRDMEEVFAFSSFNQNINDWNLHIKDTSHINMRNMYFNCSITQRRPTRRYR